MFFIKCVGSPFLSRIFPVNSYGTHVFDCAQIAPQLRPHWERTLMHNCDRNQRTTRSKRDRCKLRCKCAQLWRSWSVIEHMGNTVISSSPINVHHSLKKIGSIRNQKEVSETYETLFWFFPSVQIRNLFYGFVSLPETTFWDSLVSGRRSKPLSGFGTKSETEKGFGRSVQIRNLLVSYGTNFF